MKKVISILLATLVLSCNDDTTTTKTTASRNLNDYIFSGEKGTEYWMYSIVSRTDSNGVTKVENTDTIKYRILDRNYLHPVFGSCLQITSTHKPVNNKSVDTIHVQVQNGTIYSKFSNAENKTEIVEILKAPLEKGTFVKHRIYPMIITDMDVPITTPAGTFNTIVLKGDTTTMDNEAIAMIRSRENYFAADVNICKSIEKTIVQYKKSNKTSTTVSENQLILIKKSM